MAVGTAVVASLSVTSSLAAWTDREYVRAANVSTLNCASAAPVNSTSWARVMADSVLTSNLDAVAALNGITVSNIKPATSSSATGVASPTPLGSDAWSSPVDLSAVSVPVSAGVTYPIGASTGAYTQYGRDTSAGLSVGASGAVTSGSGGAVALETPGAATPREADLALSSTLNGILPAAGTTVANLADVHLRVGAVGALASYNSCAVLWAGSSALAGNLTRNYLVNGMKLEFTSQVVKDLGTSINGQLTTLQTTLNALTGSGSSVTGSTLTGLKGAVNGLTGLVTTSGVSIIPPTLSTATVSVNYNLTPVKNLLSTTVGGGGVTANLTTGAVTADLATIFGDRYGTSGLNGLSPNTSVLTPEVLSDVSSRLGTVLGALVGSSGTLATALTAALNAATVTVVLQGSMDLRLGLITLLGFPYTATISGTVGSFAGAGTQPTVSVAVQAGTGLLDTVLATLGITSATLLQQVGDALVTPLINSVYPLLKPIVATLISTAPTLAAGTVSNLGTVTVPSALVNLAPVLTILRTLVSVTVNARPDQPNPVGYPATAATGRYFVSALKVGVVNATSTPVVGLFLASASVGPNTVR
ncbi:choice-of-anchor G family protein [Naasia lichenicola]|uniref:Choice-of-anchor G family protein n=1 Tax=Naasia lichenicola TaxID=2565933 RepID=A0A4S4FQ00_9MICO|nr:choice-of-anchor G family protein [Naasia lichenicola]THG32388.1 choice-of-anchor G family protein [Naasia lichenicola]